MPTDAPRRRRPEAIGARPDAGPEARAGTAAPSTVHPAANPATATTRWFVALRPAPQARRALQREAQRIAALCSGRVVPAERIHLTLAFIGEAPRSREAAMSATVAALPAPQALRLDRIGSFDGRLLWIAPSAPAPWLADLASALRDGLDRLGVAFDRKKFTAHVTLVRDARPTRGPALEALSDGLAPIVLHGCTLHLVESTSGPTGLRYRFA